MEDVDKEISEMKLFVSTHVMSRCIKTNIVQLNARARFVAESFLTPVRYCIARCKWSLLTLI
jgi:hypothetical protein